MNDPVYRGDDVALFIDWENFKISLATGRRNPNVSALKEEVANHGRVVVAKAYADWVTKTPEFRGASQFINDPPALYLAGIEPVYVPSRLAANNGSTGGTNRTWRIKNSVDVKMTADCIECAHAYPNIGTYVLVSGDSDFIHVINALRTMGKQVIIIGVSWATSRRLADQVDGLILYDADVDPVTPSETTAPVNTRAPARSDTSDRLDLYEVVHAIEEIVREERQGGGTPLLTSIKQRLMRRIPNFDEKRVGFSTFKKLMARAAEEGKIKLITAGLVDWAVMSDEPDAIDPAIDTAALPGAASPTAKGRRRSSPKAMATNGQSQSVPSADNSTPESTEEVPPATPSDDAGEQPEPPDISTELGAVLEEAIASMELPAGPGDGLNGQRVADLIIMADTLEHREGISHVAFNFLVSEVCLALEEGLREEYAAITRRWSVAYSKNYVTRTLRALGNGDLFTRGWHSSRDNASGLSRRRRTFNLNREHPQVATLLKAHWETQDSLEESTDSVALSALEELPNYSPDAIGPQGESSDLVLTNAEEGPSFLSRIFRPRR